MNSNNTEQDLQAKLAKLEAEVNKEQAAQQFQPNVSTNQEPIKTVHAEIETDTEEEAELIAKVYSWLSLAGEKFNNLSGGGKLIVGIAAIWLGFTALNLVLHLISNLVIVGILGIILYFAYQKLVVKS